MQQIEKALDSSIEDYSKEYTANIYKTPLEQLQNAENELDQVKKQHDELITMATKYASRMLYFGFSMAAA